MADSSPLLGLDSALHCPAFSNIFGSRSLLSKHSEVIGPVAEPALAFYISILATLQKKYISRIWLTHPQPRVREKLAAELILWGVTPVFLPEHIESQNTREVVDPESNAERLTVLHQLSLPAHLEHHEVIILNPSSLDELAPEQTSLSQARIAFKIGQNYEPDQLMTSLLERGFERVPQIHARGQFAQRGGILDLFSWQSPHPVRLEFFDTEIESIREFDLDSQISRRKLDSVEIAIDEPEETSQIRSYLRKDDLLCCAGDTIDQEANIILSSAAPEDEAGTAKFDIAAYPSPIGSFEAGDFVLQQSKRDQFSKQIKQWIQQSWDIHLVTETQVEQNRFHELLSVDLLDYINFHQGDLTQGFIVPELKLAILSSAELFGRYQTPQLRRRATRIDQQRNHRAQTAIEDINKGDLVVHSEYGIGRYQGIETDEDGYEEIHIRYRDKAILSVPIDQSHLLARYIGMGGKTPDLSKLGDARWSKTRKAAERSIMDYAAQLLRIQAERHTQEGQPHPPDTKWMWEFENSFRFTPTPGQVDAIEDAKLDMESAKPMDRLICGDVGFGKTEVAIRAAFKAATGGSQVALMVPTTVLAEQHWRTFRERMSEYPIRIELLNRFRKPAEIRSTIEGLANGSVDIVIGTHRLVSQDITFKNLGLGIIDEEQRFGVKHKERFKETCAQVDMLTLSATPIPRTLYLSLMGARDMSTIDTAPPNKVAVQTSICAYDERTIRDAIKKEIKRGGQVFFLHNRVKTIEMMQRKIQELVPEAKISIGHGQMAKDELEVVMKDFISGKSDILLATTIIESGIDIPNANTIIIDRADRFGLADLYQLRGRVGRGGEKAYAILLLPRDLVHGDARKRINAIQEYTALGSGFKIAMRDLEIRGAGNLLGTKQSGHIAAVGFDLYCQLLKQSIDRLRGNKVTTRIDVSLRADFLSFNEGEFLNSDRVHNLPAYIPADYMNEASMRIRAYKELAEVTKEAELQSIAHSWLDRYGKLPASVSNLILATSLKIAASRANISSIELNSQRLILTRNNAPITLDGGRFPRLKNTKPTAKLTESLEMIQSLY